MKTQTNAALAAFSLILAGASLSTAAIPERPERLEFSPLVFTPPTSDEFRHTLGSGVTVYMAPSQEFPLVTVTFSFKGGSYLDTDDKVGLASLTGAMIRSGGTASLSPSQLDEEFDFLAANASTFVGGNFSGASLNALTQNFDEAFAIFMDMVRSPGFDAERLRINKEQRLEGMKQRNDSPQSIAGREWARLLWGEDHFEASVSTQETIDSITEADLRAMHTRIFHPANLIIGVTGDFEPSKMLATLEEALAGWRGGSPVADPPTPNHQFKPGVYHVEKDIPQGRVRIGHRGVKRDHADALTISLMNDILGGGGFTSRITKKVRSDEGLAYGAGSRFSPRVHYPGEFSAGFQSKSPTVALGTKLILEEIARIRAEPVSSKELETSQSTFIETFPRRFESKAGMLNTFINDDWTNRPPDHWRTYRDRVRAITTDDIQRVAERYLDPENIAILIVGSWEEIYEGDIDGRASMADFFSGRASHLLLRDPLSQTPIPDSNPN